jgi:RimJ/RimL family protein N-acetyltransferase
MEHALHAEGFGVRLRPVRMEDAAFIVWLRNLDHVKGRVGDSATDVKAQETWLKAYFKREGDYYFIVETIGGIPVGTYGIYDVEETSAEPGRWIIRPGVPAAIPCVILALDLAFHEMKLTLLHGTTVATNEKVLSLNRKLGFRRVQVEPGGRAIGGRAVDMVHYLLKTEDWLKARERLVPLAQVAEIQVRDWEKAQLGNRNPE